MKRFRFKSLTMRIWTIFTLIILIIVCSISIIYLFAYKKIDENAKIEDLKVAHDILLKGNNFDEPTRFDELKNLKGSESFILKVNRSNSTEIINLNKGGNHLPPIPGGVAKDQTVKTWMTTFVKEDKLYEKQFKETYNNMGFYFIVSTIEDTSEGKFYLISYLPDIKNNSLLYMIMIIGLIFIVIGLLTAKIVANAISKPLKELEKYTVRIARKDWNDPIKVKSDDEIGKLIGAMNHMQKELKHADEEEKMFLQSISHDLKTPVMVIMSHAEAIVDGVYIESVEKTAEIIRDEAISLEKKIKQMLYLNTLDYVLGNNSENTEINLRKLVMNIISRFELLNSNIEWELDLDEVFICGNIDKIKVSIENIVDNELRYAKEKIRITLKKEVSFAALEIYNDGPNIEKEHIFHIFDNLYKDKTGNFGLGLAISKKIIDFHKGEINVINRDKGVSFIIKFICD